MKKGPHVCEKIPLMFDDTMTCRLGCVQCELLLMQPSVLQWCDAGVRMNLPDEVVTEVACHMKHFHVHPVWLALSKKTKKNSTDVPMIVMCDDIQVARMGLYGFKDKKQVIRSSRRDNYICNGKTIFFCYDGEDGDMVLRLLKKTNPEMEVMILRLTGYKRA